MGKRRVAVACTRERDDGIELLMVHDRSGRWTLPKGAIEPGETPTEAACREALEEAGAAVVVDGAQRATWKHVRRSGRKDHVLLLRARGSRVQPPSEVWRRPTWVPLATLSALAEVDDHYRRVHRAVRRLGVRAKGRRRDSAAA